ASFSATGICASRAPVSTLSPSPTSPIPYNFAPPSRRRRTCRRPRQEPRSRRNAGYGNKLRLCCAVLAYASRREATMDPYVTGFMRTGFYDPTRDSRHRTSLHPRDVISAAWELIVVTVRAAFASLAPSIFWTVAVSAGVLLVLSIVGVSGDLIASR